MDDDDDAAVSYRSQLEQQVSKLQKQLQEEIDLHRVLAYALPPPPSSSSSSNLFPAAELLSNIAALENTVSELEQDLSTLNFQVSYVRNERRLFQRSSFNSVCTWEQHLSSLRVSKSSGIQMPHLPSTHEHAQVAREEMPDRCTREEISGPCDMSTIGMDKHASVNLFRSGGGPMKKLWHRPNQLSEEMVRCMRDIFLCLSDSSAISSEHIHSVSSTVEHLSLSSLPSFSDSSITPSLMQTPLKQINNCEVMRLGNVVDPYGVNGEVNWTNIGSYTLAAEVTWMSVGKPQLKYAAEALKRFRCLVEQLIRVNPTRLNNKERLAFWINLYNTLIMHAYLAYGVPSSDIKFFSLMQKASYTVGGQSFSAADIEYVILKMKPPSHRPEIALILALHKFKISEEHRKYSIDKLDPLAVFTLSCGMYSSPAVKIFSGDNVEKELDNAMRDYIRASVGISDKGKLLVPKLLHSYAMRVVEESLLVDWICRYLTSEQVTIVRDFSTKQKQRLLSVRSFSVVPFDSRFRYLFLPEGKSFNSSPEDSSI